MYKRFLFVSFFVLLFGFALPVFACEPSKYAGQGFSFSCVSAPDLSATTASFKNNCSEGQTLKTASGWTLDCPSLENRVCIGWKCEGEAKPDAGGGDIEDCLGSCVASTECDVEVGSGTCGSGKVCCGSLKGESPVGGGADKPKAVVSTDGAECKTPAGVSFPCPLGQGTAENISKTIGQMIKWISGTIGALFLAMFVWGGILFITAGGSGEKVKAAQGTMTSAVIGMLIIVFSFVLVDWLIGALGSAL